MNYNLDGLILMREDTHTGSRLYWNEKNMRGIFKGKLVGKACTPYHTFHYMLYKDLPKGTKPYVQLERPGR